MTHGGQCRVHATECLRLMYLSYDDIEIQILSEMARCWGDLAARMDVEARATLSIVRRFPEEHQAGGFKR